MDFSSAINFLTDNSKKFSSKAIFTILTLILLVIIDNTFSFSYYYNIKQKTEQLSNISEVINDVSLSEYDKNKMIELRNNILNHSTIKDRIYDYLTNFNFGTKTIENAPITKIDNRNQTVHFVTSSWWILSMICIFLVIFPGIILKQKNGAIQTLIGLLFMISFGYFLALLLSKLFSYIPLILNTPLINYILNFVLSSLIAWILFKLPVIFKKNKTIANNG